MSQQLETVVILMTRVSKTVSLHLKDLTRTLSFKILTIVGLLFCISLYLYYSYTYESLSGLGTTFVPTSPRFLINSFGSITLLVFTLLSTASVSNFCQANAHDSEYISILSRPMSDLEIILARLLSIFFLVWIPMCIWALTIQTICSVSGITGTRILDHFEWSSLIRFMFNESIVFSLIWGSLIVAFTSRIRTWWIVFSIISSIWLIHAWSLIYIPIKLLPIATILPNFGMQYSDLVGYQHAGSSNFSMLSNCMIVFAVILGHLRTNNRNGTMNKVTVCLGTCMILLCAFILRYCVLMNDTIDTDLSDQRDYSILQTPLNGAVDLHKISGTVVIDYDQGMSYVLQLEINSSSDQNLQGIIFSINPSLEVMDVTLHRESISFSRNDEYLKLKHPLRLKQNEKFEVGIIASGFPNVSFDSTRNSINWYEYSFARSKLQTLGTMNSIFTSDYIALLPQTSWLPAIADNLDKFLLEDNFDDYFHYDLRFVLPQKWDIAGSGTKVIEQSVQQGKRTLRLTSKIMVDRLPLIASQFTRYTDNISDGIEVNLLLSNVHQSLVSVFEDQYGYFQYYISRIFEILDEAGFEFPYDSMTIVEVPGLLKPYGNELTTFSLLSYPGLYLVSEHSLPTANFSRFFDRQRALGELSSEYYAPTHIRRYLHRDDRGESIFEALSKSWAYFSTCFESDHKVLKLLFHELVYQDVVQELRLYPSTRHSLRGYIRDGKSLGGEQVFGLGELFHSILGGGAQVRYGDASKFEHSSIWNSAVRHSTNELMNSIDSESKYYALQKHIQSLVLPIMARETTRKKYREIIKQLVNRSEDKCTTTEELTILARSQDVDLDSLLNALTTRDKPRLEVSSAKVRTNHDSTSDLTFSIVASVYNNSNVEGLAQYRLDLPFVDMNGRLRHEIFVSEIATVPPRKSIEFGMNTDRMPTSAWIVPVAVSENRFAIPLDIVDISENGAPIRDALLGFRDTSWKPKSDSRVIVDDLSDGVQAVRYSSMNPRVASRMVINEGDSPTSTISNCWILSNEAARLQRGRWCRVDFENSFGEYRRSMLMMIRGRDDYIVEFPAELPNIGSWKLEFHVPDTRNVTEMVRSGMPAKPLHIPSNGILQIVVLSGEQRKQFSLDLSTADAGWNEIGVMGLPDRSVDVRIASKSANESVVADAIRWTHQSQE